MRKERTCFYITTVLLPHPTECKTILGMIQHAVFNDLKFLFSNQDPSKHCILHLVGHFDNKKERNMFRQKNLHSLLCKFRFIKCSYPQPYDSCGDPALLSAATLEIHAPNCWQILQCWRQGWLLSLLSMFCLPATLWVPRACSIDRGQQMSLAVSPKGGEPARTGALVSSWLQALNPESY